MSEQENFATLREIAPDASDERIRAVLKKHANLDMAVNALLEDPTGENTSNDNFIGPLPGPLQAPLPEDDQWTRGRGVLNAYTGNRNNSPVQIDLTRPSPQSSTIGLASASFIETDKSKWALTTTSQSSTTAIYGPHPDPSGSYAATQRQQDDDLSMAITASLQTSMLDANSSAAFEELSLTQRIRLNPDTPVTLRSRNPHLIYEALLVHALYHVPQVREAFAEIQPNSQPDSKEIASVWKVMARLAMGTQSDVIIDDFLPRNLAHSNGGSGMLKEVKESTEALYNRLADHTRALPSFTSSLFYSNIWAPSYFGAGLGFWSAENSTRPELPIIPITSNVNSIDNSLISYLHELTWTRKLGQAAEVLAFSITHEDGPVVTTSRMSTSAGFGSGGIGGSGAAAKTSTVKGPPAPAQKHLLQFPALFYVDPFLLETREITSVQRNTRMLMEATVRQSETRLNGLGGGSDNTPLKNLRASIKYLDELALDDGDALQNERRKVSLAMLKEVLAKVEGEIEALKGSIQRTKEEMAHVYDVTGLQKHPYGLRAVLMWDGVYGRTHTYSYVRARNGKWYKCVESTVTEVEEKTVLSDPTGLHMGAGPFMLIYSQSLGDSPVGEPEEIEEKGEAEGKEEAEAEAEEPAETREKPAIWRTYSSVAEEYMQWHPAIRHTVRLWNGQFRTALEDAGIVDAEGRVIQDSSDNVAELVLPEDPLVRIHFEETEDNMEYDSDAKDIDQEEVTMDTSGPMTELDLANDPLTSQEVDLSGWGPQGNSRKWDENQDWGTGREMEQDWKTSQGGGEDIQDTVMGDLEKGIQVKVTRNVESDADNWESQDIS